MPSALKTKKQSLRRQTWPRCDPRPLETIMESPKTPQEARFSPTEIPDPTSNSTTSSASISSDSQVDTGCDGTASSQDTVRNQMIWYSHHLAESYRDRQRLSSKMEQLENVCRSQSKTNATLLEEVRAWQENYDVLETDLLAATQEIEKAKTYIRIVETSNTNLRYALIQAREEQERARKRSWRVCLSTCWQRLTSFSRRLESATCRPSILETGSPFSEKPPRMVHLPTPSADRIHLLKSEDSANQLAPKSLCIRATALKRG